MKQPWGFDAKGFGHVQSQQNHQIITGDVHGIDVGLGLVQIKSIPDRIVFAVGLAVALGGGGWFCAGELTKYVGTIAPRPQVVGLHACQFGQAGARQTRQRGRGGRGGGSRCLPDKEHSVVASGRWGGGGWGLNIDRGGVGFCFRLNIGRGAGVGFCFRRLDSFSFETWLGWLFLWL